MAHARWRCVNDGRRPPDDQELAQVLDGRRAECRADPSEERLALIARVIEDADLDELVSGEVGVDLLQHRRREPVVADADYRVKVMRSRAERSSLCR